MKTLRLLCIDTPSLMDSLRGSTVGFRFLSAHRPQAAGRWTGTLVIRAVPNCRIMIRGEYRDLTGSWVSLPVPLPWVQTPPEPVSSGRNDDTDAAPSSFTLKASELRVLSRLTTTASTPAASASRHPSPDAMQGSLPTEWLLLCREGVQPSGIL